MGDADHTMVSGAFAPPDPDDLIIEDDGGAWVLYITDHGTVSATEHQIDSGTYFPDEGEAGLALTYGGLEADRRKALKAHHAAIEAFDQRL